MTRVTAVVTDTDPESGKTRVAARVLPVPPRGFEASTQPAQRARFGSTPSRWCRYGPLWTARRWVLVTCVLPTAFVAGLSVGIARASTDWSATPVDDRLTAYALRAAEQHFGRTPDCGIPAVVFVTGDDPTIAGLGDSDACRIGISADHFRRGGLSAAYPPSYCALVLHEYGHVLGLEHAPEGSHDVMAPGAPVAYVPECQWNFRRVRDPRPQRLKVRPKLR